MKTLGAGPIQHFTDAAGVQGITGLILGEYILIDKQGIKRLISGELAVGQTVSVERLSFGQGSNTYLATNPGDIFVTEIGPETTAGKLASIGVFGDRQDYVIEFSRESAFAHGVRLDPSFPARSIFGIPQGTIFDDPAYNYTVTRLR